MGPVKVLTMGSLKAQMQFESANRHKRRKTKQNQPLLVGKGFLSFLLKRDSSRKNQPGDTVEQHCPLQTTETKTSQARKKSHSFCWVFAQRTGQRGCQS